jgi:archaellum biogenesis ATPase FlaH
MQVKVVKLPDIYRNYTVIQKYNLISFEMRNFKIFGMMKISPNQIVIENTLTKMRVNIPKQILLTPTRARLLSQILNNAQGYRMTLLAFDSHEIIAYNAPTTAKAINRSIGLSKYDGSEKKEKKKK